MIERMKPIPKVKDVFPVVNSIFTKMDYTFPMSDANMDIMWNTKFGKRTVGAVVEHFIVDDELSEENIQLIANLVLEYYKTKWDKYNALLESEYDPIHNYLDEYHEDNKGTEDATETLNGSENRTEGYTTDNTSTMTNNLTEGQNGSVGVSESSTGSYSRYGFNSSAAVGVESDSISNPSTTTSSNTITNTGTRTIVDAKDENLTVGVTKNDSKVLDSDKTGSKDGYHRGNIGNITTQQLIREELDVWKWNFVEQVLRDAAELLTLPLYDHDVVM